MTGKYGAYFPSDGEVIFIEPTIRTLFCHSIRAEPRDGVKFLTMNVRSRSE